MTDPPSFGDTFPEGQCQGCEDFQRVNDLGLCAECAEKLDRDLIRQRDWEYSVTAFGVARDRREDLRNHIIKTYGRAMELIAADPPEEKKTAAEKRKQKKAKRRKARRRAPK